MTMLLQKILRFVRQEKILQRSIAYKGIQFSQKGYKYGTTSKRLFISSPFVGMWGFVKKKDESDTVVTTKEVLLAKADALFDQREYKEIYNLLSNYRDSGDVEILWRLSRTLYNMAQTIDEVEAKKMIYEAYDLICTALNLQEDNWVVHKWMSILLDTKCNYEGMKARLRQLYNVKKHMLRAVELNPEDATVLYMLGSWCYHVSDLAWYQRKIAAAIFGEPPNSSFEEALVYFEHAEKVDSNFYSHNLLMLGKTYLKLNRKEDALEYLKRAFEFPARNDDDLLAKQEAQKLLNNI